MRRVRTGLPAGPTGPGGRGDTPDAAERGLNPDAPAEVAAGLLGYLRRRWETPDLAYADWRNEVMAVHSSFD